MRALGDDDDAEKLAVAPSPVEVADHLLEGELELGDDDEVGAARKASHQGDPARVPAHHLDDHHAMVCGCCRVQPV